MRTSSLLALVIAAAACGGRSKDPTPPRALSADEHLEAAAEQEVAATELEQSTPAGAEAATAEPYVCGDRVLADQLSSGTEPLLTTMPCWQNETRVVADHKAEAERLRAEAGAHKEVAQSLINAEALACEGMSADELTHTPYAHRQDIVSVDEERTDGELRGARIVFAKVAGLSANWMRQAVACHHARAAALGYNNRYMSYDPTVIQGASTMVNELADGSLEVKVISPELETAKLIYDRSRALVGDVQARR
jgi:hypothetical protein